MAVLLGHSSVNTTMAYTGQQTLDLVRALETTDPNMLAIVQQAIFPPSLFSISGRNWMTQRLIVEWSTDTPRASIISSR